MRVADSFKQAHKVVSDVNVGRFFAAPATQPPGTAAATSRETDRWALHLRQSVTRVTQTLAFRVSRS